MLRDLRDAWSWIQKLVRRVERVESGALLENSSITGGRMRFIGGTLRVDSGGRVEIVGTLQIDGGTEVTGSFTVSGPWELEGNGTITGNVTVVGPMIVTGTLNVTGNSAFGGTLAILGATTLSNDLTVLPGGKIQVGSMVIDPSGGGSVAFPGGASVQADPGGGVRMVQGANRVYVGPGLVSMQMGGRSISISASGIQMDGLDTINSDLANGAVAGTVWTDGTELYRVIP